MLHNDIIILNKNEKPNPRIYLPTLTPVDDDEPFGPTLSPFIEVTKGD